jgi:hypothetical protein
MIPGHWLQPTAHYRLQPALLCLLWLIWGALAHADPFVATSAAVDCLEMFDKQQQQQSHGRPGSSSHAQSRRFLDPKWQGLPDGPCEEPLRPLVEEMASGASVLDIVQRSTSSAAVAQLVHWLSGFKLVRCVSRSVEGLHSLLARILKRAPAAKVPYLSFEMRSAQLSELMLAPAVPGQHPSGLGCLGDLILHIITHLYRYCYCHCRPHWHMYRATQTQPQP